MLSWAWIVGWLDEKESLAYANIVGKTKNAVAFVDFDENTKVSLSVNMKKTKIDVSLSDGKPVIDVMLSAEMMITTVNSGVDFTDSENLDKLTTIVDNNVLDLCEKTLYKAQHELKTDIFGFGESIHRAYPKVWSELKDDWDTEFTKLQVNLMMDTKITDFGENLKSIVGDEE